MNASERARIYDAAGTVDIDKIIALIEAARKIIKTKDGVPVHHGMVIWELDYDGDIRSVDGVCITTYPDVAEIEECYSTRAAAEAARGERD